MLIDIHTHTVHHSDDSSLRLPQLIARAKELGLDGICLTDHDRFWDPAHLEQLSQEHGLLILPGAEMTCDEAHFLVYGLHKWAFGMHHATVLREAVTQAGGVMVLAHPFRRQYEVTHRDDEDGYSQALDRVSDNPTVLLADAVETVNGRAGERSNRFSRELAHRVGRKGVGGSDAHAPAEVGRAATEFPHRITSLQEFIAELRAGRCRARLLRPLEGKGAAL